MKTDEIFNTKKLVALMRGSTKICIYEPKDKPGRVLVTNGFFAVWLKPEQVDKLRDEITKIPFEKWDGEKTWTNAIKAVENKPYADTLPVIVEKGRAWSSEAARILRDADSGETVFINEQFFSIFNGKPTDFLFRVDKWNTPVVVYFGPVPCALLLGMRPSEEWKKLAEKSILANKLYSTEVERDVFKMKLEAAEKKLTAIRETVLSLKD